MTPNQAIRNEITRLAEAGFDAEQIKQAIRFQFSHADQSTRIQQMFEDSIAMQACFALFYAKRKNA